jgi:hypothetical protein
MFLIIVILSSILFFLLRDRDEIQLKRQIRAMKKAARKEGSV